MLKDKQSIMNKYPGAAALLEELQAGLNEGIVPAGIFNDQELYEMEMDQIFGRKWILVGHDSEIASNGDYMLRYVGDDPLIIVRDEDGDIHALLDACCHRGVRVCRAEKGNTSHFRCPYHGWTYKNNGQLIGMPSQRQAYNGLNKEKWGLQSIRAEMLHGMIFVCFDDDAEPLEEYLQDVKYYLDLLFGLSESGMEVIGEPQRVVVKANWKLAVENFSGDDYHLIFLHHAPSDVGAFQFSVSDIMNGYHIQAGNGHCVSLSLAPGDIDNPSPYWNFPKEMVEKFNLSDLNKNAHNIVRNSNDFFGNIYPSSSFILFVVSPDGKDIAPTPFISLKQWMPKGPDKIEIWNWFLMFKDAPEEFKLQSYRAGCASFSISGIFEVDDTTVWETATQTAGNRFTRERLKLNYQMGLLNSDAVKIDENWDGPGTAYYPRFGEGNQRYFLQTYLNDMLGQSD